MPSPASCYECMESGVFVCGRPQLPGIEATVDPSSPRITARYPGHCRDCNTEIHEGEEIVRMSDDTWQHAHHHPQSPWSTEGHR